MVNKIGIVLVSSLMLIMIFLSLSTVIWRNNDIIFMTNEHMCYNFVFYGGNMILFDHNNEHIFIKSHSDTHAVLFDNVKQEIVYKSDTIVVNYSLMNKVSLVGNKERTDINLSKEIIDEINNTCNTKKKQ